MGHGYEEFRELNNRINRENDERRRLDQSRSDAERRHQQNLAPLSNSGGDLSDHIPAPSPSELKTGLLALLIGGCLILVANLWGGAETNRPEAAGETAVTTQAAAESSPEFESWAAEEIASASRNLPVFDNGAAEGRPPEPTTELPRAPHLAAPTLRALDSGETVGWEAEGVEGIVSVSAALEVGDRTCRTVRYSVVTTPAEPARSEVWCRSTGRDWSKRS